MLKVKCTKGLIDPIPYLFLRQAVVFKSECDLVGAVYSEKLTAWILKDRCRKLSDFTNTKVCCAMPV